MRLSVVFNFSSVLFKSYLRASRRSRLTAYSQPKIMLIIDVLAVAIPLALLEYVLPRIPKDIITLLEPIAWQALVGLPMLLTSAVIVAGIMFELGQSGGLSSSEAVNWLPISPREYVAASAISIVTVYSPIFAVALGVTLPLALEFGLMNVWPVLAALSTIALFLGALIVEILRAALNRVSSTVYKRSGRLGMISRLVIVVVLFVMIQLAFNPNVLYQTLGVVVSGLEIVWFIPMVWPSVAIMDLLALKVLDASVFSVLSVAFMVLVFEAASSLRLRYWSPAPVSIVMKSSVEYVPRAKSLGIFGFDPVEIAIAFKDFRALVRRKDMARFLAIPIMLIVSFTLPALFSSGYAERSPGFFFLSFIPFMVPLMFSMTAFGQEGRAVINLCMLPISAKQLVKGKLLPAWTISVLATIGAVAAFQIVAPISLQALIATVVASIFVTAVEGLIGLGAGARYPDYTVGSSSRYVTFTGFLVGFVAGGASALAILVPTALYVLSSQRLAPLPNLGLALTIALTAVIGSILSYVAYKYCKSGVQKLVSNLQV